MNKFECPCCGKLIKDILFRDRGYRVEVWEERDRLGIWVTDEATGDVVFEVWDDDARQHFEDGRFVPGTGFEDSVLVYLRERKMIRKKEMP